MTDLLPAGFVFHQSNLQAFQNCRFSFLLRYVRKLPWPAPLAARTSSFEKDLFAGSTLHALIHQYFLGIDPETLDSCARNYPDSRVEDWFNNFLSGPYARRVPAQFPEFTQQITLHGSLLLAKFDLLTYDNNEVKICDWKTSRGLPRRQFLQDRIQTKVYSLVAARSQMQGSRLVTMHYWEASYPDQPIIFEFDDSLLNQSQETIIDLITCIRSLSVEQFERTAEPKKCSYCEYQSYCSRSGSVADEETYHDWFEIGLSELAGQSNKEQGEF